MENFKKNILFVVGDKLILFCFYFLEVYKKGFKDGFKLCVNYVLMEI